MNVPLVLDLFSGIGGFSLGLERAGMRTVAFCEIDPYCRAVLRKHWPDVPCYDDIRTLTAERLRADGIVPDVICGGYPCQPFSVAGFQRGKEDDRHLWPEVRRLLDETGAGWFLGENVAGHIELGLDDVLSDLEGLGYTARTFVIPACAVGAPHERNRVWIVAHADSVRPQGGAVACGPGPRGADGSEQFTGLLPRSFWLDVSEAGLGGMDDGLSPKIHRLRSLGNSVVPQIPEMIGRAIMETMA